MSDDTIDKACELAREWLAQNDAERQRNATASDDEPYEGSRRWRFHCDQTTALQVPRWTDVEAARNLAHVGPTVRRRALLRLWSTVRPLVVQGLSALDSRDQIRIQRAVLP